jgi:outer membrane protein
MKTYSLIFLFFLSFTNLLAQTDSSFTLQQCIDYALKNEVNIKNAEIDQQISESQVKETRAIGYPKVTGSLSLVDNPALQRMFFSTSNPFLAGGGGSFPGAKKSGDVIVAPNLFQLRSAGDANAQLSQLIFDGSYIVGLQAATTFKDLSNKNLTHTKIQTVENVTKDYYGILIAEESVKMFDINLKRLDSSLYQLRATYENGLAEDIDVKRLEVQYNNLLTDKQNSENLLALGHLKLKMDMGMPLDQPIKLADSISSLERTYTAIPEQQLEVTKRIEYSTLQTQEKLAMLDLKRYKFSRLPTLAAFAKGGAIRQDIKFLNLFQNQWYGYGMLGLSLNVPIVDFTKHAKIQQAKYTTQKVHNSLGLLENGLKIEATSARLNYNNSIQAMQNQKRNMELAQEVVRVSKIKFQEGIGSNLEVVNAEADLQTAQINYYRALFDGMIAKINYEKATGSLYNE